MIESGQNFLPKKIGRIQKQVFIAGNGIADNIFVIARESSAIKDKRTGIWSDQISAVFQLHVVEEMIPADISIQ
jgi:hypothetical protein